MRSRRVWIGAVLLALLLAGSLYLVSRPIVQAYSRHTSLAALERHDAELRAQMIDLGARWRQLHEAARSDRKLSQSREWLEEACRLDAAMLQTAEEQGDVRDKMQPYLGPKSWLEQVLGW
jgi:hypothetical protein